MWPVIASPSHVDNSFNTSPHDVEPEHQLDSDSDLDSDSNADQEASAHAFVDAAGFFERDLAMQKALRELATLSMRQRQLERTLARKWASSRHLYTQTTINDFGREGRTAIRAIQTSLAKSNAKSSSSSSPLAEAGVSKKKKAPMLMPVPVSQNGVPTMSSGRGTFRTRCDCCRRRGARCRDAEDKVCLPGGTCATCVSFFRNKYCRETGKMLVPSEQCTWTGGRRRPGFIDD